VSKEGNTRGFYMMVIDWPTAAGNKKKALVHSFLLHFNHKTWSSEKELDVD
jgi:hypothetical protein